MIGAARRQWRSRRRVVVVAGRPRLDPGRLRGASRFRWRAVTRFPAPYSRGDQRIGFGIPGARVGRARVGTGWMVSIPSRAYGTIMRITAHSSTTLVCLWRRRGRELPTSGRRGTSGSSVPRESFSSRARYHCRRSFNLDFEFASRAAPGRGCGRRRECRITAVPITRPLLKARSMHAQASYAATYRHSPIVSPCCWRVLCLTENLGFVRCDRGGGFPDGYTVWRQDSGQLRSCLHGPPLASTQTTTRRCRARSSQNSAGS